MATTTLPTTNSIETILERQSFRGGECIRGFVQLSVATKLKSRAIKISVLGYERAHWTEQRGRARVHNIEKHPVLNISAILHQKTVLSESGNASLVAEELPSGIYRFPFVIQLPENLLPTHQHTLDLYHMKNSTRVYEIEARVDVPGWFDVHHSVAIHIQRSLPRLMPSTIDRLMAPLDTPILKEFWFGGGDIRGNVILDRQLFSPGELVPFTINIDSTKSNRRIERITVNLNEVECWKYIDFPASQIKYDNVESRAAETLPAVESGSTVSHQLALRIPDDVFCTLEYGALENRIIQIVYRLEVVLSFVLTFNLVIPIPITILPPSEYISSSSPSLSVPTVPSAPFMMGDCVVLHPDIGDAHGVGDGAMTKNGNHLPISLASSSPSSSSLPSSSSSSLPSSSSSSSSLPSPLSDHPPSAPPFYVAPPPPSYPHQSCVSLPSGWTLLAINNNYNKFTYVDHLARRVCWHTEHALDRELRKKNGNPPLYPSHQSRMLPPGWEISCDNAGRPYLLDHQLRRTLWSLPGTLSVSLRDLCIDHRTLIPFGSACIVQLRANVDHLIVGMMQLPVHEPSFVTAMLPVWQVSLPGLTSSLTMSLDVLLPGHQDPFTIATADVPLVDLDGTMNSPPKFTTAVLESVEHRTLDDLDYQQSLSDSGTSTAAFFSSASSSTSSVDSDLASWVDLCVREMARVSLVLSYQNSLLEA